jgi:hypothetical protein
MQIFFPERDWKLVWVNLFPMTRVVVSQAFPDKVLRTGQPVCAKGSPVGSPLLLYLDLYWFASLP